MHELLLTVELYPELLKLLGGHSRKKFDIQNEPGGVLMYACYTVSH